MLAMRILWGGSYAAIEHADRRALALFFTCLSDTTRLLILTRLVRRDRSIRQLCVELELPNRLIGEHLSCLVWCGFVVASMRLVVSSLAWCAGRSKRVGDGRTPA